MIEKLRETFENNSAYTSAMTNPLIANYYSKDLDGSTIIKSVALKKHRLYDLWYRPGTSDSKMIKESIDDYVTVNCANKIVMDCGANIGGFTRKAAQDGAKTVVSFEPESLNFEVLSKNAEILRDSYPEVNIQLENFALCNSNEQELTFNLSASSNSACSGSLVKTNRSFPVTVKACNFWEKVEEIRPQVLKIDIEGAEYSIFDRDFPDFIEDIAVELHGYKQELRKKMFSFAEAIEQNPNYEIVNKQIVMVFNEPKIILLHFKRVKNIVQ